VHGFDSELEYCHCLSVAVTK